MKEINEDKENKYYLVEIKDDGFAANTNGDAAVRNM